MPPPTPSNTGPRPGARRSGRSRVRSRCASLTTQPLLDWLAATRCSRVAVHFGVDTIDSNEIVLGRGAEPGGLTTVQVQRIADVVGLTIAEFIPRQVMRSSC
jgi:hypothetical protein